MFVPAFFGLLLAAFVTGQSVHITPTHAVRRVGSEVTVLCKVDPRPYGPSGIDSCRISINGAPYRLRPEDSQAGDVVYFGQGLQLGECGARIRNIKEDWNGLIVCNLPPASGNRELEGKMTLTVAKAPQPPVLLTPDQVVFREGDRFDAQCIVANGRPPASIKWYLGDELLLVGLHDVNITKGTDSKHPDAQTISQNLTRTVRADDSGRMLTCSADHEALETPTNASRPLNVQYPPKHVDGESSQITIFGLKLGAEGRLNVTVRANPPPNAEWTVGAERLRPMQKNQDGTITALEPVALGGGYYNVTLVLMSVNKEDVDRAYHLRVFNDLGGDELSVRISTMDERAGVELETGAIVGIVVAVLALLIAAFLIVFAKATDRWCFAGRSHRTDIPDGGDSEAPLPPHDDVKGSENPSHDHEYIGSNGDTKHPEKKPDTAV